MAQQAHLIPLLPFTEDFPQAMGEVHDLERPPWLHLTVALLLKNGLRNLEIALTERTVPKVNWSNPWIRERNRYPWEDRPPSEAALSELQLLMVANRKGPFDALGDTYGSYTRIRVQEYLNRYAAHYGSPGQEGLLLDRDLPERFMVNVTLRKIDPRDFYARLSVPFSIGIPGEKEIEPLLRDIRDEQHAKELNRLREAFRPHIQSESASMALFFHPTEIDPQARQCTFAHEVGLILSEAERKKVRRKGASDLWNRLNGMVNDLIRWAVQIPTDLSALRESLSPEVVAQVPFHKRDELRRDLNSIALTQAGNLRLTEKLARYSLAEPSIGPGEIRGPIPEMYSELVRQYREFIQRRNRNYKAGDCIADFLRTGDLAQGKTSDELRRVREKLRKVHRRFLEKEHGISQTGKLDDALADAELK